MHVCMRARVYVFVHVCVCVCVCVCILGYCHLPQKGLIENSFFETKAKMSPASTAT